MGLSNKLATKMRTKDASAPVAITAPMEGDGALIAATIVRAAAIALQGKRLSSSGHRGHDTLGIASTMKSGTSSIWIEQSGDRQWSIGLGLQTHSGRAYDWQLRFVIEDSPEGRVALISTPQVLTRDGTQVHKGEYRDVRDIVLTGFSLGRAADPTSEIETVAASLGSSHPTVARAKAGSEQATVTITTQLPAHDVAKLLSLVPFRRIDSDDSTYRFRVDLDATGPAQEHHLVTASLLSNGAGTTVQFTRMLAAQTAALREILLMARANALANVAYKLIKAADPAAGLTMTLPSDEATR